MRLKYEKVIHRCIVNNLFRWDITKKSCNAQGSRKYYLVVTAPFCNKKILFYDNNNLLTFFIMIKYSVVKEEV